MKIKAEKKGDTCLTECPFKMNNEPHITRLPNRVGSVACKECEYHREESGGMVDCGVNIISESGVLSDEDFQFFSSIQIKKPEEKKDGEV